MGSAMTTPAPRRNVRRDIGGRGTENSEAIPHVLSRRRRSAVPTFQVRVSVNPYPNDGFRRLLRVVVAISEGEVMKPIATATRVAIALAALLGPVLPALAANP